MNQDLKSTKNDSEFIASEFEDLKSHQKLTWIQDCQHLRFYGINKSGFYPVDPDGPYDPLKPHDNPSLNVYCDFENNITKVYHDQGSNLDFEENSHAGE